MNNKRKRKKATSSKHHLKFPHEQKSWSSTRKTKKQQKLTGQLAIERKLLLRKNMKNEGQGHSCQTEQQLG